MLLYFETIVRLFFVIFKTVQKYKIIRMIYLILLKRTENVYNIPLCDKYEPYKYKPCKYIWFNITIDPRKFKIFNTNLTIYKTIPTGFVYCRVYQNSFLSNSFYTC